MEIEVPETILCVDCLGQCHRLTYVPEDGFAAGDVIAYRCEDCLDRWDLVFEDDAGIQ
jgi:hypothetical protein